MIDNKLIIGTRGSELALWQAYTVRDALLAVCDKEVEVKIISTRGDERLEIALHSNNLSKGLFTEELERDLRSGEIDFAVHSLKDLPVDMEEGLTLSAVLKRADPRDVVLSNHKIEKLSDLSGHLIGTSSPRRVAQLKSLLDDSTKYQPIRGNVKTRIKKLRDGDYDSLIMAAAGIERLGLQDEVAMYLPLDSMLPAPGQASVAVQCATSNEVACHYASLINDEKSMLETSTERQLLLALGGGCALPLGALCEVINEEKIKLSAVFASQDLNRASRLETICEIDNLHEELRSFSEKLKASIK
ncbi:hydroxymethylbilane synthase [Porphyromonadaceae bacterium W3.11]|nr:hydroxymethylbilane synthase [Porphyromonadaceae bacterium W3.11]